MEEQGVENLGPTPPEECGEHVTRDDTPRTGWMFGARDLCFSLNGQQLIHHLNFDLKSGDRTIMLGPNGAGKSLTLRLCHGILSPSSGSIRCDHKKPLRQAMVFQRPIMLGRNVEANIRFALSTTTIPSSEWPQRIEEALGCTGLGDLRKKQARRLSIGQQQRLALARVWAVDPDILFLDEPTASLDPGATREVERIVDAVAARGTKIVMTTHDLGQARRLADDVLFLHKGALLEHRPAASFFDGPVCHEAVAYLRGELLW